MLVPDVDDLNLIGDRLRILYYLVAFVCVVCFLLMIIGTEFDRTFMLIKMIEF